AALARAREILGLPPVAPKDPYLQEKQKLEAVRLELSQALVRVNEVLKSPGANGHASELSALSRTGKISVKVQGSESGAAPAIDSCGASFIVPRESFRGSV